MSTYHKSEHLAGAPRALNAPAGGERSFAFLLGPGFTLVGFASAIEALRMAHMVLDAARYRASTVSLDGEPAGASNGVLVTPDHAIATMPHVDSVVVCGPNPIRYPDVERLIGWLQRLDRDGLALGSIDSGSELLARAGLLDGYRCTIHWQDLALMRARYPALIVSNRLYEIDRNRFTSGGGTAAMDMMLELIRRDGAGSAVAGSAADLLVHDRMRSGADLQREPLRQRLGTGQPALRTAVAIMEGTVNEALPIAEIAAPVRLSARQLERLFRAHLGCTPNRYYRDLRLNHARREVLYSDGSIGDISRYCGFNSSSHFARRYAELFDVTPNEDRRRTREMHPA